MAIRQGDNEYVTVEKGDTLWDIAQEFLGEGSKYKDLAAINSLVNPDLIYPGEVIYLTQEAVEASKPTKTYSAIKATIQQFGLLSSDVNESTLFATWNWSKESQTESYKVEWVYDTGDGLWLNGSSTTNTVDHDNRSLSRQSTYSIPTGARRVRFRVKPISKKKDNSESVYFTASWSDSKVHTDSTPLQTPSAPSNVKIDDLTLTVSMDGFNAEITKVEFQIIKDNAASTYNTSSKLSVKSAHVSYSCNVVAGSVYKVRCRIWDEDNQKSEWSPYSSNVSSKPSTPSGFTACRASSETSVYLEWAEVKTAKSYDIEYTTEKKNFDLTDQTSKVNGITLTRREIVGLESGDEYFFRFRAINENNVASDWSGISSVIIGEKPEAPTTWSSTTTAIIGEDLILYWTHNTKDGSYQRYAEIEILVKTNVSDPGTSEIVPIQEFDEDDENTVSSYVVDTTNYSEDTILQWRVRTRGITTETSDWSIERSVTLYIRPELHLSLSDSNGNGIDEIHSFPFKVTALSTPASQLPIGYYLTITANETYDTTDAVGNIVTVSQGSTIYSKYFDINAQLETVLSAGDVDLENGISYTISCTVSLNSGLTAEGSLTPITVSWSEVWCEPNAEIGINPDTFTAYITPYCEERQITKYKVTYTSRVYKITSETVNFAWGEAVPGAYLTTGEPVYLGVNGNGESIYFCEKEEATVIDNVTLSVYRREFDGSFTLIANGLDATNRTIISDPHPALDYARYRIVATDKSTGTVSYSDLPGYPVGGKAVVIQWDEHWSNFEVTADVEPAEPAWSGSLLKLPYNVDVSNSHKKDSTLVEYIGRSHPVSYYGTQIGETATWNVSIDAEDAETLYALRRLAKWMGDVYVREPSGSGYWAHLEVSFSQKHLDLTIPVTLSITRVEGGI